MPIRTRLQNLLNSIFDALKEHRLIIVIVLLSFTLRMLWLHLPINGDEGEVGYTAMLWSQGYLPYVFRLANRGPLMYLLWLIPIDLFGNTIIPIRMLNNILFLISIVVLYLIAKDWYGKRAGLIAAFFYGIFMSVPALEGQFVLSHSLSLPFVIFSVYFCNRYSKNLSRRILLIAGIFISAALLIRQTQGIGIILLIIMIVLARHRFYKESHQTKLSLAGNLTADISILAVGVILPIAAFIIYFWSHGALGALIECSVIRIFTVTIPFVESATILFAWQFLAIVEGLPLWLFAISGFVLCVMRWNRNDAYLITWTFIFGLLFIKAPLFGHHFLPIVAPAAILSGMALSSALTGLRIVSIEKFFIENRQKVGAILVIVILILSFVPSAIFQAKQYPNCHIQWEFIDWPCADNDSYDRQVEVANHLKSNTSEDGQVFIHGWCPQIYWLGGLKAPNIHLASIWPGLGIPVEEYQRLLDDVKTHKFESVALVTWVNPDDSIAQAIRTNYFYVKTVDRIEIYSKYDPEEEYEYYSFIENFPQALKEYDLPDGTRSDLPSDDPAVTPKITAATTDDEARITIFQHPVLPADLQIMNSHIIYSNVSIPRDAKLKFGIAIDPRAWDFPGDGVQFKILIQDDQGSHEVFSQYIDPKHNIEDRKWHDFEIDLTEYANKTVNISFVTNPGPSGNSGYDWANWSEPIIYAKAE